MCKAAMMAALRLAKRVEKKVLDHAVAYRVAGLTHLQVGRLIGSVPLIIAI